MIEWLLNWIKVTIGRWLLADELEAERERDREKWLASTIISIG